jgi:hypothetical protein
MSEARVVQLRRLGVALAAGGVCLGGLSLVVPGVLLAGGLLVAAIVVGFEKPSGAALLNLGPALGALGVLLLAGSLFGVGPFDAVAVAGMLVAAGVFDVVAAPWLARYVDGG